MTKETTPIPKKSFNRSDLISIIALVLSIGAFGVALYEANILKQQQEIMLSQQKASIWPYLKIKQGLSVNELSVQSSIGIENKGLGPASISDYKLTINGDVVASYTDGLKIVKEILQREDVIFSLASDPGIIASGEVHEFLKIFIPDPTVSLTVISQIELELELCYCSVYNDCWMVSLSEKPKVGACQ